MENKDLSQITTELYLNLETVDLCSTFNEELEERTNKAIEQFKIGYSLESYTDELIALDFQTLNDLANVFKNIINTCSLSREDRLRAYDNIEDPIERDIVTAVTGIISKNIFTHEISTKETSIKSKYMSKSQKLL